MYLSDKDTFLVQLDALACILSAWTEFARSCQLADGRLQAFTKRRGPGRALRVAQNLAAATRHLLMVYPPRANDQSLLSELHTIVAHETLPVELTGFVRRTMVGMRCPRTGRFEPRGVPAAEIPDMLGYWEQIFARENFPSIARCGLAHLLLESIHPFADGNGRTGRLAMMAFLMEDGEGPLPLHFTLERHRDDYLREVDRGIDNCRTSTFTDWLRPIVDEARRDRQELALAIACLRPMLEEVLQCSGLAAERIAILMPHLLTTPVIEPLAIVRQVGIRREEMRRVLDALVEAGLAEAVLDVDSSKLVWLIRPLLALLREPLSAARPGLQLIGAELPVLG